MIDERNEALISAVEARGYLPDEEWRSALRAVPRHVFTPARGWVTWGSSGNDPYPIDKDARPVEWWGAVYEDAAIVTQADDGQTDHTTGEGQATSSLSALSGVLYNLGFLDVEDDHKVLEIGTGTGYTAALTSQRVGDARNVTSIEIDPEVAKQAEANLEAAGYAPNLIVGDGALGCPENAPYDRVHATCAVRTIPYTWIEQTRPGGRVVTPYDAWFGYGMLAQVDVMPDGTAIGRFPGTSGYMILRSQRPASDHRAEWTKNGGGHRTRVNPRTIAYAPAAADLAISVLVPGVVARRPDDALWLFDGNDSDCWAIAQFAEWEDAFEVQQTGNRRLWDEVEAAYFQWVSWGRPSIERFGLTVTPDGDHVWLDNPSNVIGKE